MIAVNHAHCTRYPPCDRYQHTYLHRRAEHDMGSLMYRWAVTTESDSAISEITIARIWPISSSNNVVGRLFLTSEVTRRSVRCGSSARESSRRGRDERRCMSSRGPRSPLLHTPIIPSERHVVWCRQQHELTIRHSDRQCPT